MWKFDGDVVMMLISYEFITLSKLSNVLIQKYTKWKKKQKFSYLPYQMNEMNLFVHEIYVLIREKIKKANEIYVHTT